ncbi:MAG: hypothetical protein JJ899_06140, partial [Alphaproteobacteria bacterium]|nr:hypothetical protein [Alphaproteobacteria bacterium]
MDFRSEDDTAWWGDASEDACAPNPRRAARPAPDPAAGRHARVAFVERLARTLPRLSMTDVPLQVFEVSSPTHMAGALGLRLRAILGDACEIAEIDACAVGVLFYGPPAARGRQTFIGALRTLAAEVPLTVRVLDVSSVAVTD